MIKILFFVGFVVTVAMASCGCGTEPTTKPPDCGCGMKPKVLCGKTGEFCGRGPNRKDCCKGYTCKIAPDDSSAYCVKEKKPKCGEQGASCGLGVTSECCKGFYCIIPPNDSHGYCDSKANPTCAKRGDTCGAVGTKTIFCCTNLVCNYHSRPDEPPFCDGWATIG